MFIVKPTLFIFLLSSLLLSADIYKETQSVALYPPSGASIISPGGRYFVYNTREMDFIVMELGSALYSIQSQYIAWTPPYPQYKKPDFRCFYFSPDDKYLITDNYVFDDAAPIPINWLEIWDIEKRRIERQVAFRNEQHDGGCKLSYDLESKLRSYFNRSPYRDYAPNARIVFSPDGRTIFFTYPGIRVFSFPGWEEKTGTFNLLGVDKDKFGTLTYHALGAPAFFHLSNKVVMPVGGNTFIFNNFYDFPQDYYKIDGVASHIEISRDDKVVLFDNKLYLTDFAAVRTTLPRTAYISPDGTRLIAGQDLFSAEPNFGKLIPFYLGDGSYYPSSTREFLYIASPRQRSFFIHRFSTGELLQTLKMEVDEYLFRDTDTGQRLLFKNKFTGKVRVFERMQQ